MFKISKINDKMVTIDTCWYGINGLKFSYIGDLSDKDTDLEKIESILNKVFSKDVIYKLEDMERVIKYIRTICCGFNEEELFVSIRSKDCESLVLFDKGNLVKYMNCHLIDGVPVEYTYDVRDRENYVFKTGTFKNGEDYTKSLNTFISKQFDIISILKKIKGLSLSGDLKKLCKAYQMFYHENPNFNDDSVKLKLLIMIALLDQYKVSLCDYYCVLSNSSNFIIDDELDSLIGEMKDLGVIDVNLIDISFNPYISKIISAVSDEVFKYFNGNLNDLDSLNDMIKVYSMYVRGLNNSNHVIVDNMEVSQREAKLKMLERIDKRIEDR